VRWYRPFLAGVGNGDFAAVFEQQHAGIARLATAQRVEHGAVQHDALRRDGEHLRAAHGQARILAKEFFGHVAHRIARPLPWADAD
jgi:hypothetical protein